MRRRLLLALLLLWNQQAEAAAITTTWALGANGVWNTGANWSSGVPNNGGGDTYSAVVGDGLSLVTLNVSPTIDNLTIGAGNSVDLPNSRALNLVAGSGTGLLTNAGALTISGGASITDLNLTGTGQATFAGAGSVTLGNSNSRIRNILAASLLNDAGHTIQGAGVLGLSMSNLDNQGTISANQAAGTLTVNPSTLTNGGVIAAAGGGTLSLTTTVTNTGTLQVNGGTLNLNSSSIDGGVFTSTSTGSITSSTATLTGGATFGAGASLNVANGSLVKFAAGSTYTHAADINLNAGASTTDLQVTGTGAVTVSGAGTLNMNGGNARIANISSASLINDTGHLIRGAGTIGASMSNVTNNGRIRADNAGSALFLSSSTFTNNAAIEAGAGATLEIGTTLTNSGGTIEANGGTVDLNSSTLSGAVFTSTSTGTVLSNSATLSGGATIGSGVTVNINNGNLLRMVAGSTYTHQGDINLNSAASSTDLQVTGTGAVTLSGAGVLNMGSATSENARIVNISAATLINGSGHAIRGAGSVGLSMSTVTNDGEISATFSGRELDITSSTFTNNSVLRATAGATLNLTTNLTNAGGTLQANGGTIDLNSSTLTGANFTTTSTGTVTSFSASLTGANTIGSGVSLEVANGRTLTLTAGGVLTNNGAINVNGGASITDIRGTGAGAFTIGGSGVLTLGNANSRISNLSAATFTNGAGHTVQGAGSIGTSMSSVTNNGTFVANGASNLNVVSTGFTNSGTVRAESGRVLDITTLSNFSATTLTGGTYEAIDGTIEFTNADVVTNQANVLLSGVGVVRNHLSQDAFRNFANNGAAGVFTLANGKTLSTTGNLANSGGVTVGTGSGLNAGAGGAANYNQSAGSTTVNGTLAAANVNLTGGTLGGSGTVDGSLNNTAGTVGPGNSPGTLTVDGDFTQGPAGSLFFELGGASLGLYDRMLISGLASLGGTLQVSLYGGFNPDSGDEFQILTFGSRTGDFVDYLLPTLRSGLFWDNPVYSSTSLTLRVGGQLEAPVPEPGTWALTAAGLAALLARFRRTKTVR